MVRIWLLYSPLLLITTFAFDAHWTFTWGPVPQHIDDGTKDSGCKPINHSAGQVFEFDKPNTSTCVLHLYGDDNCTRQSGIADKPWWKNASGNIYSYQMTDCPNDDMPRSDKIALGVGIGIGLPACLTGIVAVWLTVRRSKNSS